MTSDDRIESWVIERIEEYLDGDLPDDERDEMELRIAADPATRDEVEEARIFRRVARAAGALPIPEELPERIRERVAELRPSRRGRVILLSRALTVAVAAAIIILIFNPIHIFESESTPQTTGPAGSVARRPQPGTPSPVAANDELLDWLDQARNLNSEDAGPLRSEVRERRLLAQVRSRLGVARGPDRAFLQAAEDLLIQVENGISPEALLREAQMVAQARY